MKITTSYAKHVAATCHNDPEYAARAYTCAQLDQAMRKLIDRPPVTGLNVWRAQIRAIQIVIENKVVAGDLKTETDGSK